MKEGRSKELVMFRKKRKVGTIRGKRRKEGRKKRGTKKHVKGRRRKEGRKKGGEELKHKHKKEKYTQTEVIQRKGE